VRRSPTRTALAAALALALAALPAAARGAACCMSATAFGTGRLLIWEELAVGLRTTFSESLGAWGPDGRWRPYDTFTEREVRTELWTLVGLSRRAAVFARAPWVVTHRAAASLADTGGGLGDLAFGLRYELLTLGEYAELPAVALTLSATAPTGRATHDAETPLGVDVTDRGSWALAAGLSLEHTALPYYARLDLGVTVPLPFERPDLQVTQRFGPELTAALAGGAELAENVVLSLIARATWALPLVLDGETVDDSDRLDLGLGLAGSWRVAPHWTLQLAVDSALYVDDLGKNQPGRLSTTLGLRYGHF